MRILAFDIGGTSIKYGIVDEKGKIYEKYEIPTRAKEGGEALMKRILSVIGEFHNIDRIGVSTAGQVDSKKGSIIFATDNLPGWTRMDIKKRIEDIYSIPTSVENDVNCAAIGEAYYGAGREYNSFLCLTYGTGIGGAIVDKKQIYRGSFNSAGEFGHMITHAGGNPCTCGGRGCYETYASTSALIELVKKTLKLEGEINGRIIFDKVNEGDMIYKEIVDRWIDEIVIGISSLVHIFNPSLIVLGGGIMKQEYIVESIKEKLPDYIMRSFRNVKIESAKLGNDAGILGASIVSQ
ncbi:ROK family protein [Anaerosalibacter sp. Marseille-P3206]|uniref:ROK family protein n=1 Tax=Anaerosalibacter sp. Marseille-P3206 TaxID=1871005 RepID=UPI0009879A93|nr:ROK family protein [Anaerosalibacter sp. Marseille-P3206]